MNDSLSRPSMEPPGSTESMEPPGSTELADISCDEVSEFVSLCGVLNERAKGSNRLGRVVADSLQSARAVTDRAEHLLPPVDIVATPRNEQKELRQKLVNVRLSDDEFARWSEATNRAGFPRVSTWVRYTVAGLLGYDLASPDLTVPAGLDEVRRQLAGAITNVAQLSDLAEEYDAGLHDEFADVHARVAELLRRYHALGKRA
ncbi:MAG: hypothetical protein WAW17_06890 [Rhodococcus sp. (in: high G+C Gram-positive bacteria)]|uniref:hypothetical protein n=1 Tax=Rhodococcus sp. TaxID=1831 RepID=UPI003BAF8610